MSLELTTKRLILRRASPDDADAHIAMMQNADVARFLTPDGKPRPRADEWRAYASMLGHWDIRGYGFFSVFEKSSGDWVGRVGPWMPEGWPSLECGWSICAEHWGKGYAPEAAVTTVRWIFDQFPELDRIISLIDADNANSQAVAAKIGETKSGEVFEFWGLKLDIWSADRKEWLKKFG